MLAPHEKNQCGARQMRAVPSWLAEAMRLPSGKKVTLTTPRVCLTRRAISLSSGSSATAGTNGSINNKKAKQRMNQVVMFGSLRSGCEKTFDPIFYRGTHHPQIMRSVRSQAGQLASQGDDKGNVKSLMRCHAS